MLDEAQRFCAPVPGQIGISVETSGRTLLLPVSRCDFSWNNFRILADCLAGPQSHSLGTRSAVIRGSGFWSSVLYPPGGSVTAIPAGGAPGIDPTGQILLL